MGKIVKANTEELKSFDEGKFNPIAIINQLERRSYHERKN